MTVTVFSSVTEIGAAIASGSMTSQAVCQMYLDQIAAKNGGLSAIAALRDTSSILADAAAADARIAAGTPKSAIDGVPFSVKMIFETENLQTSTGVAQVNYVPPAGADADVVAALRSAGGILIGKSNAPGGPVFTDTMFGNCLNPHNAGFATAGSSGGSAVAVAAGLTGFEVGSDSAGSIRMPASYCGVYGMKCTNGAISDAGDIWPVTPDRPPVFRDFLHSHGPLARSLDDVALLVPILNGATARCTNVPRLVASNPPPTLKKAVLLTQVGVWYIGEPILSAFKSLVASLNAEGVQTVAAPTFPFSESEYQGFYNTLEGYPDNLLNTYYPTPNPSQRGWNNVFWNQSQMTGSPYESFISCVVQAEQTSQALWQMLADADVILCPTHAVQAPVVGATIADNITYMCMTILANITGWPSISIPLGVDGNGVPFGVQVMGKPWSDLDLIQLAKQVDVHSRGFVPPNV